MSDTDLPERIKAFIAEMHENADVSDGIIVATMATAIEEAIGGKLDRHGFMAMVLVMNSLTENVNLDKFVVMIGAFSHLVAAMRVAKDIVGPPPGEAPCSTTPH
jgi:hypothetical protein